MKDCFTALEWHIDLNVSIVKSLNSSCNRRSSNLQVGIKRVNNLRERTKQTKHLTKYLSFSFFTNVLKCSVDQTDFCVLQNGKKRLLSYFMNKSRANIPYK